jgi:integrase
MGRKMKYERITSPDKLEQVNPFNKQLQDEFLTYLQSVQRSPRTIAGYENDLSIFWVYVLERAGNKKFNELTKRDFIGLQNWLINEHGNSPARVRRIKAAISSMSNYIERILDDEPEFQNFKPAIKKVENPVLQPVREKTVWEDDELEKLLDSLSETGQHKRACAVALAMCSGRRKAELPRFRVCDFAEENLVCGGALYKTSEPIKTKGFGMGKFIHCYTLAKKFKPYFDAWIKEREELGIESEWLLPDGVDYTQPIKISALNHWADLFTSMTGRPFYWHALRHYFTTDLSKAGLPDGVIQSIIGWQSADMVAVYKDISAEDQIAQYFDADGNIKAGAQKSLVDL